MRDKTPRFDPFKYRLALENFYVVMLRLGLGSEFAWYPFRYYPSQMKFIDRHVNAS